MLLPRIPAVSANKKGYQVHDYKDRQTHVAQRLVLNPGFSLAQIRIRIIHKPMLMDGLRLEDAIIMIDRKIEIIVGALKKN